MDNSPVTRKLVRLEGRHLRGIDGERVLVIGEDNMGYIVDVATQTLGELFHVDYLATQGKWLLVSESQRAELLDFVRPLLQGYI